MLSMKWCQSYYHSYNNNVSLFDRRKPSVSLSEVDVSGGVWRVKWNPHENRKKDLLVACMLDGFKVLRYENGMQQGQIVQRFDDHESLAYGVDWSFGSLSEDGKQVVGSCSFYDHLLHIWRAWWNVMRHGLFLSSQVSNYKRVYISDIVASDCIDSSWRRRNAGALALALPKTSVRTIYNECQGPTR